MNCVGITVSTEFFEFHSACGVTTIFHSRVDTPADRLLLLLRHSVHSRVMIMRTPFLLAMTFRNDF